MELEELRLRCSHFRGPFLLFVFLDELIVLFEKTGCGKVFFKVIVFFCQ
jgi:hypothetical protein